MFSEEYEFTAAHEAGHLICVEHFPPPQTHAISSLLLRPEDLVPRTTGIILIYDGKKKRFDGNTWYEPAGLLDEQLLFIALGGPVAEVMARDDGNWDTIAIQKQVFSGRFDDTKDMDDIDRYLDQLSKDRPREVGATTMISRVGSALERNWELVLQVATEVLSKCDPETHEGMISYDKFFPETQARLMRLRDNR